MIDEHNCRTRQRSAREPRPSTRRVGSMRRVFDRNFHRVPIEEAVQVALGAHVDVSHVAATPVGMSVTAEVELISVDGKTLRFRVRCSDDAGVIGEGTHGRAVTDLDRFWKRVLQKRAG